MPPRIFRALIASLLFAAPLAACYNAPVAQRRVAKAEKPAPAPKLTQVLVPSPEPVPVPVETEVAPTIVEDLIVEDTSCPMSVAETTVAVVETETGAALMFETAGVAEVQSRLDTIAMNHNKANQRPIPDSEDWGDRDDSIHASGGVSIEPSSHPLRITTPSQAVVETHGTGVRLVFTAEPQHIEQLREEIRAKAISMASGRCSDSP